MSKGPGLFSDIGKISKDLLIKDYTYDQKLTISTTGLSGAWVTTAAVKKGLFAIDIGRRYKYKNALVDIKFDTDLNISTTLTVPDILPSTRAIASLKFGDHNAGKVNVQYFHHHAGFSSVVTLKLTPVVQMLHFTTVKFTTVGAHGVAFGAEAGFDTASGNFTKCNAGISLTKAGYNASIILADKGDTLKASYVHHLGEKQKSAAVAEIILRSSTNESTFTVGGAYAVDPQTTVKARLNNSGVLGALIKHKFKSQSVLTISGELDEDPKFGLALALKR